MKQRYVLFGLLLAAAGCDQTQTTTTTTVEVPVSVEEVGLKPIEESIVTTGTVAATEDFILKSETTGFYRLAVNPRTSKTFALGDQVKKDEVIVYLDNPEQENSIRIDSVKLNLETTKNDYETQKKLFDLGGVTEKELKASERSVIDAQYSYDNAVMQLAKMKIVVPFDGIITTLPYYTPSMKVPSGSEIAHVMNYKALTMEVNIPGTLLGTILPNQKARITNYAVPDSVLIGKVTQVSTALDPDTRTFNATLNMGNPNLIIRPGMFIKAEIIVASRDSTIVIPKDIVISRRNRKTVYVIENSQAVERLITTGLENTLEFEVLTGISKGERIVVEGFETLRNGSRVRIND